MKKKIGFVIGLMVVGALVAVMWEWMAGGFGAKTPAVAAPDPKNGTYGIEGTNVTLAEGVAQTPAAPGSASMITTKYFGNEAMGDLNGDGIPDEAFLITQDGAGSGTFYYAVAMISTSNGFKGTNAMPLGDRIAPQTTEIRDGEIIVNYADRAAGAPITAQPSVGVSKYFVVRGASLVEASSTK